MIFLHINRPVTNTLFIFFIFYCGSLDRNAPLSARHMELNIRFPIGVTIWGRLGRVVFLEEVVTENGLWGFKSLCHFQLGLSVQSLTMKM